jgi:hypothetical protein
MSIKANIVGFIGIETYDIILYTAKLLYNLKKKVLVIDQSESEALTFCIPIPDTMNAKLTKINFSNIEFIKDRSALEFVCEYDYILIDFGFSLHNKEVIHCSQLFFVTDKQQHNIFKLQSLKINQCETHLIIKDVIQKENAAYLFDNLKEYSLNLKDYFYLYYDDIDKENMTSLQYSYDIKLKKLSGQFRYMLFEILSEIFGFDISEIGQAYKHAKRGA